MIDSVYKWVARVEGWQAHHLIPMLLAQTALRDLGTHIQIIP